MRTKRLLPLALLLLGAALSIPAAQAGELIRTKGTRIDSQYIVVLRDAAASLVGERADKPPVATVAGNLSNASGARLRLAYTRTLRGFAITADYPALKRLLDDPRVAYVEEDAVVYADANQNRAPWGLDRIDQRDRPLNGTYGYDSSASTVHAYVVDTGIRATHTDFNGRVSRGYSVLVDGYGTADCNGHGTHVAGTIGGATWGVAKGVRLHPVRVLGCDGTGSNSAVIAGLDWIAANRIAPAVANLSLGGGASTAVDDAVARLVGAGVTVVVAAGNDNANACNYSPARAAAAITVAATTPSDARSPFSNFGSCVDLFAPGSSITSSWSTGDTAANTISGTSMAAPHVAGVAAQYLATHPMATPAQVAQALIGNASTDRVSDAAGAPNRLLYSLFDDAMACNGSGGTLSNGIAVGNLCAAAGAELHFALQVPAGASELKFATTGGGSDVDLYVKYGAMPSTASYDCKSDGRTAMEVCTIPVGQAGTYFVLLRAYSNVAGLTLTGRYVEGRSSGNNATRIAIPDKGTAQSTIQLSAPGNASPTARVQVAIRHSFRGDLRIELVAPDGSSYLLKKAGSGGSADDVVATYTVNLSSEARSGTWRLRVSDVDSDDSGYIDSWSLSL